MRNGRNKNSRGGGQARKSEMPRRTPATTASTALVASRKTAEEHALAKFGKLRAEKPPLPWMQDALDPEQRRSVKLALGNAIGTSDEVLLTTLLNQLMLVCGSDRLHAPGTLNAMLALMMAFEPRNSAEALLAAQMAAIHTATMRAAMMLSDVRTPAAYEPASNVMNKLARTFTTQVEALKRFRTNGEQTVRVHRVTVNEGGQAIVGNVTGGANSPNKNKDQCHEHCEEEPRAAPSGSTALLGNVETD
jgi:hypothetical protein